jgi:branched-chain amino acid transport system substrate-binding protein
MATDDLRGMPHKSPEDRASSVNAPTWRVDAQEPGALRKPDYAAGVLTWSAPVLAAATVTVYSSLPLAGGPDLQHARGIVRGAVMAQEEAGGNVGPHSVKYVSLNDGTRHGWAPERVQRNALRAAQDERAVAYIGDYNSGASAISIPILNEAGVAQISPTNAHTGLTRGGRDAQPGEPDKYYPAGYRTYARIAPTDRVQGRALATAMRDRGCRRVAVLHDGEVFGRGVAVPARRTARRLGLDVVLAEKIDVVGRRFRALARRARHAHARCIVYAGISINGAPQLFRALARALPSARLFASDGVADRAFMRRPIARRVLVTTYTLPPSALPPDGQEFFRRYTARWGDQTPDPYAVYGYESMRLVLDAVAAAGPDRRAIVRWLHRAVRDRPSPFGPYSIDRFGDTSLRAFGLYRIRKAQLEYVETIQVP